MSKEKEILQGLPDFFRSLSESNERFMEEWGKSRYIEGKSFAYNLCAKHIERVLEGLKQDKNDK